MGLFGNLASGAVGYGIRTLQDKRADRTDRINEIRNMSLRDYLSEYCNAHHIVADTNDMDRFARELQEIAHDCELGIQI